MKKIHPPDKNKSISFEGLSQLIQHTHTELQSIAAKAINRHITIRNWLIGYYIVEFEQNGNNRAMYGSNLLESLERSVDIKGLNVTLFTLCRKFYSTYPQIASIFADNTALTAKLHIVIPATLSQKLQCAEFEDNDNNTTLPCIPSEKLISNLSFSHIKEILPIEEPQKRLFYEIESIKANWSVRELRRQINTLLYERCGMSISPEKLIHRTASNDIESSISDFIKQPFTFEFLGLRAQDTIEESDLEQALMNNLQEFLLELGVGFCFEARQKRIIIDDEYYFADLVFYHRLLHCHVIVELKNDEFRPDYISQLNTYVAYYKSEVMAAGDNPPVGILLCTNKRKKLVEYATAGMDSTLFVSQYMLRLPDKKTLEQFIINELER